MAQNCFSLAVLCLLCSAVSYGQIPTTPVPEPTAAPPVATYAAVKVAGRLLFSMMGASGLTASERADKVNRRLNSLIARDKSLPLFTRHNILTHGDETTISLDGDVILAVTEGDAQDALTTRDELAVEWGEKMVTAVNQEREVHANFLTGSGILIRNTLSDIIVSMSSWLPRFAGSVFILFFFSMFARFNRWALMPIIDRAHFDSNVRHLLRTLVYYGTWTCGVIGALITLGLNGAGLATTIGISGFVFGFAFKDILSHLFAGLMLLLGQQFHVGDQIVVKEFEGSVERIELRALYLRTYDNRLVIIPNGDVFTSAVTSNTDSPFRRREFAVRIEYGDNIRVAQAVTLAAILGVPGVSPEPVPEVLVDELSATTIILKVRFHTHSHRADYLRVESECMIVAKEALVNHRISMPSSVQSLSLDHIDQLSSLPTNESEQVAVNSPK